MLGYPNVGNYVESLYTWQSVVGNEVVTTPY